MSCNNLISQCFGVDDLEFSKHPLDEERAFEYLTCLRSQGIPWAQARADMSAFLVSKNAPRAHISTQLEKARRMMKPWLQ